MTSRLGGGPEFDAIRRMEAIWGEAARELGDDAAVLELPAGERLVASVDTAVEGRHFRRAWLTPREIGYRAITAAASDLAAMAARPAGALIALALPDMWLGELDDLARGIGDAAVAAGLPIIGGNLSAAGELSITTTVLGSAAAPLRRDGAREGDAIFVTGRLGGPGAALSALRAGERPRDAHRERLARPVARIREAQWLAGRDARAAIDISDGLAADLGHLAAASGVRVEIDVALVPCVDEVAAEHAVASGEEFELALAAPASLDVRGFVSAFDVPLNRIGTCVAGAGVVLRSGDRTIPLPGGFDHFAR